MATGENGGRSENLPVFVSDELATVRVQCGCSFGRCDSPGGIRLKHRFYTLDGKAGLIAKAR